MDNRTPEARSRNMARVRCRDTKPELVVRRLLHRLGYRFRLHRKDLPGKPDIVLPKYQIVIFVNGCFWHQHPGCKRATRPASNPEFWHTKLEANRQRDRNSCHRLKELGWRVLVIWECETRNIDCLSAQIERLLVKNGPVC